MKESSSDLALYSFPYMVIVPFCLGLYLLNKGPE